MRLDNETTKAHIITMKAFATLLLIGLLGVFCVVALVYILYITQYSRFKEEPAVVQRVVVVVSPTLTASPSATLTPTRGVRRLPLVTQTPRVASPTPTL